MEEELSSGSWKDKNLLLQEALKRQCQTEGFQIPNRFAFTGTAKPVNTMSLRVTIEDGQRLFFTASDENESESSLYYVDTANSAQENMSWTSAIKVQKLREGKVAKGMSLVEELLRERQRAVGNGISNFEHHAG